MDVALIASLANLKQKSEIGVDGFHQTIHNLASFRRAHKTLGLIGSKKR
jgi:hypothetical protein